MLLVRLLLACLALSAIACSNVAQTAYRMRESGLDCGSDEQTTLPSDPALGGGATIADWVLARGSYGIGQGPGIALVARDAFRLFVNGRLLAENEEPLRPVFVPLTLLPGDNAVTVVVSAAGGEPAVLFEVDELEREIVSDGAVRVSDAPSGDYTAADYDDSAWNRAVDRGSVADNPRCRPAAGFPAASTAHWLTAPAPAQSVAFRLAVRIAPVGFGAPTTGGDTAEPVLVSDAATLTDALAGDEPAVILVPEGRLNVRRAPMEAANFDTCPTACPSGTGTTYNVLSAGQTCDVPTISMPRNERRMRIGSNKTLVGLGRGAQLRGAWFDVGVSSNVILRNLAIYDVNRDLIEAGDGISVGGVDRLWVDHVTFKWISDGFIDVSADSTNVTFSWLRYDGENPAACLGRHPRANELVNAMVTFHHTIWTHVNGRAPLVTHSLTQAHLYNDLFSDDVDYAVGAGCDAQILLEGSYFEKVVTPSSKRECTDGTVGLGAIQAPAGSNAYGVDVGSHDDGGTPSGEPHDAVFTPPYSYTLDPTDDVRFRVGERAGAGARWALPLTLD